MKIIHGNQKGKPLRLTYAKINGLFYLVSHNMQDIITLDMLAYKKGILITDDLRAARWYTKNECIEFERKNNTIRIDIYKRQKV